MPNVKSFLLLLLYMVLIGIGLSHHEIWLDEAHHWLLAKDSHSIKDLVSNCQYEGHPILWNLLLFFVAKITDNIVGMQVLHFLISATTIAIFIYKSPFPFLFKVLFVLGYFPLFEYAILSRNYMLGILFIFLASTLYERRDEKFIKYALLLALAANVHAIFLLLACSMMLLEIERLFYWKSSTLFSRDILGFCLFGIGVSIALWQIIPPSDTPFFDRTTTIPFVQKLKVGIVAPLKALLPIANFSSIHFWNTSLFLAIPPPLMYDILLACYTLPLFLFYDRKKLCLFIYLGFVLTHLFLFITQMSALRYDGIIYLFFIIGLWCLYASPADNKDKSPNVLLHSKAKQLLICGLLGIHTIGGLGAYYYELRYPFSNVPSVANYLNKTATQNTLLVSYCCEGTAIRPFIEKDIYTLCTNETGSYCIWKENHTFRAKSSGEQEQILVDFINQHTGKTILLIAERRDRVATFTKVKAVLVFQSDLAILRNRNFYLYKVELSRSTYLGRQN